MSKTIDYYNSNSDAFFENTVNADMSAQYHMFEKYLSGGARILDLGCGSGRDTKHFIGSGFDVVAIDGSEKLCKIASEHTGIEVKRMFFQDLAFYNEFDGIWACASLLHIPSAELENVMKKLKRALVSNGIIYLSFKKGNFEGERNGRYFTDLDEKTLKKLIETVGGLTIKKLYSTQDVRPGREEEWLNAIIIRDRFTEIKKKDEIVKTDSEIEVVKGEVVIEGSGNNVSAQIDRQGVD